MPCKPCVHLWLRSCRCGDLWLGSRLVEMRMAASWEQALTQNTTSTLSGEGADFFLLSLIFPSVHHPADQHLEHPNTRHRDSCGTAFMGNVGHVRRAASGPGRGRGHARAWWTAAAATLVMGSTCEIGKAWAFVPAPLRHLHGPQPPSLQRQLAASVKGGRGAWPLTANGAKGGPNCLEMRTTPRIETIRCSSVSGRSRSSRLYAVDVDESKAEDGPPPAVPAPPSPSQTNPMTEADRLQLKSQMFKLQAEKLRLEAEKEQIKMERETLLKKQKKQQDTDRLVEKLRAAQPSTTGAASAEGAAAELKAVVKTYLRTIDADSVSRIRELSAEADTPEQALAYTNLADAVIKAIEELDGRQAKEIREELAFRFKDETPPPSSSNAPFDQFSQVEAAMRNGSNPGMSSIDQLTQEMMRNNTRGFSTIYAINLPQWLPREFMRTLESFEPLLDEDVRALRTEVFKMDTFFVTDVDKTPLAVAYMGTLRKPSEEVFKDVERRLQDLEGGLKDRVQLFLFENPRPQMQEMGGMMGGGGDAENPEVMFMAVSTRVKPLPVGGGQATLSLLSLGATALNCLVYSILTFYSPADIVNKLGEAPLARLDDALPVAAGILGIQLAHDLAHNLMARAKDVKLGVPIYIPSLQVGTFGSVLRFVSFPKRRKDMFDVALAGPLTGLALSFAAFAAGMAMTQGAAPEISAQWPMLPVALFRSSLMLWQVGQALFSADVVSLPLVSQIHVHPLAVIGALGLLTQALQAMPIGRLDGGRASTSVFGRKAATFLSASLVLYQVVSGVVLGNTLQLFWGTVVIIFQNAQEMYARDEISPVDNNRRNLLLLLWAVVAVVLLPGVPWRDAGVFDDFGGFMT